MLRSLVKTGIAGTLHSMGLERLVGKRMAQGHLPLIICYHRVVEDFEESARRAIAPMLVSTGTFEKHLDWIGKHYDYATLDEILAEHRRISRGGRPRRRQLAAVTFDDGYADVLQNAVPIMNSKGIPSAMFVVTDLVGTGEFQMHDELHLLIATLMLQEESSLGRSADDLVLKLELEPNRAAQLRQRFQERSPFRLTRGVLEILSTAEQERTLQWLRDRVDVAGAALTAFRALTWEEVRKMMKQDVTIGSHTRSHALLSQVSARAMEDEVQGSREILEQELGRPVHHFAYPDGRFNKDAVRAVEDADYQGGYTICTHRDSSNPLLTIPRKVLWEHASSDHDGRFSPAILSCQVNGIFDPARLCRHQHGSL